MNIMSQSVHCMFHIDSSNRYTDQSINPSILHLCINYMNYLIQKDEISFNMINNLYLMDLYSYYKIDHKVSTHLHQINSQYNLNMINNLNKFHLYMLYKNYDKVYTLPKLINTHLQFCKTNIHFKQDHGKLNMMNRIINKFHHEIYTTQMDIVYNQNGWVSNSYMFLITSHDVMSLYTHSHTNYFFKYL